jgi:hypothetical protein
MNFNFKKTVGKISLALIFGAVYGLFIGLSPLGNIYVKEYCYDLGGDEFLFESKQIVMSICAALAFYTLTFLTIKGWKGLLKTIAVSYLCLFLYAIFHIYYDIRHDPCFLPWNPTDITGEFLIKVLFISLVITTASTIILVPTLIVCKRVLARLFAEKDDFLKLDLNAK